MQEIIIGFVIILAVGLDKLAAATRQGLRPGPRRAQRIKYSNLAGIDAE